MTKKTKQKKVADLPLKIHDAENVAYSQEKLDSIKLKIESRLDQAVIMGFSFIRAETGVKKVATFFFPKPVVFWAAETPSIDVGGATAIVSQMNCNSIEEVVISDWDVNNVFVTGFVHGYDMSEPECNTSMETFHSPRYIQGYWMGAAIAKKYIRDHSGT